MLLFAVISYFACLGSAVYAMGFLGNFVVEKSVDAAAWLSLGEPLIANICLLMLFALQHGAMARTSFRVWLSARIDTSLERSVYCLTSSISLLVLMLLWQPLGGIVWVLSSPVAWATVMGLYFLGWALTFYASFLVNHFELFGLRQAFIAYEGGRPALPRLQTSGLYSHTRHPMYLGCLIVLWSAPTMTLSRLLLAAGVTIYLLIGIQLQERDLESELPEYRQYKRKVPMLLPSWRRCLSNGAVEQGQVFEAKTRCVLSHEKRGRLRHRFSLKF